MCDEETCRDLQRRNGIAQAEVTRLRDKEQQLLIDLLALRDEMQWLHDAGHALAAALSTVEWVLDEDGSTVCSGCEFPKALHVGHHPDCYVDAALTMASQLGWR